MAPRDDERVVVDAVVRVVKSSIERFESIDPETAEYSRKRPREIEGLIRGMLRSSVAGDDNAARCDAEDRDHVMMLARIVRVHMRLLAGDSAASKLPSSVRRYMAGATFVRDCDRIGGGLLGMGKDGTRVYTADYAQLRYQDATQACVWRHAKSRKDTMTRDCIEGEGALTAVLPRNAAIKDIVSEQLAREESVLNERIFQWFTDSRAMTATPLHPDANSVDVTRSDGMKHRLIVQFAYEGDCSRVQLSQRQIAQVAAGVLRGLSVFHAHKALHTDVKPLNILWKRDARGEMEFVLADYDLVTSFEEVRKHATRGSSPTGTQGFMSPLLTQNEITNGALWQFHVVCEAAAVFPHGVASELDWEAYFDSHRSKLRVPGSLSDALLQKGDVHSLALTMLDMLRNTGIDTHKASAIRDMLHPAMLDLLVRLMLIRPGDPLTAKAALRAVSRTLDALPGTDAVDAKLGSLKKSSKGARAKPCPMPPPPYCK